MQFIIIRYCLLREKGYVILARCTALFDLIFKAEVGPLLLVNSWIRILKRYTVSKI